MLSVFNFTKTLGAGIKFFNAVARLAEEEGHPPVSFLNSLEFLSFYIVFYHDSA